MTDLNKACASCRYWHHAGDNPAWCDAAVGYTDPEFTCEDWRDLNERTDPMTGEPWEAMKQAPVYKILPVKENEPILPIIPGFKDEWPTS